MDSKLVYYIGPEFTLRLQALRAHPHVWRRNGIKVTAAGAVFARTLHGSRKQVSQGVFLGGGGEVAWTSPN